MGDRCALALSFDFYRIWNRDLPAHSPISPRVNPLTPGRGVGQPTKDFAKIGPKLRTWGENGFAKKMSPRSGKIFEI